MALNIPTIDLSPFVAPNSKNSNSVANSAEQAEQAATARAWDKAMRSFGFAYVVGHGVFPSTVRELTEAAQRWFVDASAEEKSEYHHGSYGCPAGGYTPVGGEAVGRSRAAADEGEGEGNVAVAHCGVTEVVDAERTRKAPADLVESFIFPGDPSTWKPPPPPALVGPATAYYAAMTNLLSVLHRVSAVALGLDEEFFTEYYPPDEAPGRLRLAFYPKLEAPPVGSIRYAEHTDYQGFTILLQDTHDNSRNNVNDDDDDDGVNSPSGGGLQVKIDGCEGPRWVAVPPVENGFVVNVGDLFEVWTNGRWKSAVHRVTNPAPNSDAYTRHRLSVPFFTGPRADAVIEAIPSCVSPGEPIRHPPIRAEDHLLRKLAATNQL